jgi:tRNA (guanosine-2'-O-)-methyltransferase
MITPERQQKIRKALASKQPTLTVVLENICDPHNVSAVLRSCDAVGIVDICLLYHSGEEFPRMGKKASASALKWIDRRHFRSIQECYQVLRSEGRKIYTTHLEETATSLYELDLKQPVALVFGNEHSGVSEEAVQLADGNFVIPQAGMINSLNISVACAVTLYEAFRQRRQAGMYDTPQYTEGQLQEKFEEWCAR